MKVFLQCWIRDWGVETIPDEILTHTRRDVGGAQEDRLNISMHSRDGTVEQLEHI